MTYLLQVASLLALVYGLYYWSLRRLTHHNWTRAFLLFGLLGAWVLPQVSSYLARAEPIAAVQVYLPAFYVPADFMQVVETTPTWGWQEWGWLTYGVICSLMLLRLLLGLGRIGMLYRTGRRQESDLRKSEKTPCTLIVNPRVRSPFSFFKWVFVPPTDLEQRPELFARIMEHELVHVRQWHSLDLLLVELSRVVLWWHPLLPAYRKAMRQSHEFQADAAVLRERAAEKTSYGRQLLSRLNNPSRRLEDQLANQFYHSFISKRLQMMNTLPTHPLLRWKYALLIPILFTGVLLFAGSSPGPVLSTEAGEQLYSDTLPPTSGDREVFRVVEEMPMFPVFEGEQTQDQANRAMLEFIYRNVKYPREARAAGVEGMAVVSFVVEQDGSVGDVTVVRDPGNGTGEEAARVVELMNEENIRWIAGRQNGKTVRVLINLPIRFKLEGDEDAELETNIVEGEEVPEETVHVIGLREAASDEAPDVYRVVDQMPLFPGAEGETYQDRKAAADMKMLEYIYSNVRYPSEAQAAGAEGMAVVSFIVETDGTISEVQIRRDPGYGMGTEAMRVVEQMNDDELYWEPGRQGGEVVRVQFNLPIRYKLSEEEPEEDEMEPIIEDQLSGHNAGVASGENNSIRLRTEDNSMEDIEIYVDGELYEESNALEELDPNDIESISVIKDADQLAQMARYPNTTGIILIQTKAAPVRRRDLTRGAINADDTSADELFQAQFATLAEGIRVQYTLAGDDMPSKLYVFDISGRLLETRPFQTGEVNSTVALQQRGVYVFVIEADGDRQSYKINY